MQPTATAPRPAGPASRPAGLAARHQHACTQRHWRRAPLTTAAAAATAGGEGPEQAPPPLAPEQEQRLRLQYERGHCYGCGAPLQIQDPEVAGYVERERYEIKRRHRQLGQLLCFRCQELSNGAMIPAVADFAQRPQQQQPQQQQQQQRGAVVAAAVAERHAEAAAGQGGAVATAAPRPRSTGFTDKVLLTPEELRQKLKVVQSQRALVVLLVDLLDASGSILGKVRDLVGNNPIMLIGTKVDLLPPGTDPAAVAEWLHAAAAFKRISAVSVHLVSSKSNLGVPAAVAAIRRERKGRDVYVMGAANVGKSAFIRALVRDMSKMSSRQYDPMAMTRGRYLPVESAMPGTTLELIPMEVFAAGGMLYDTPGLHLHHRVPHLLTPTENKQLHPRRKLRPYVPPSPAELLEATSAACSMPPPLAALPGGSDGGGAAAAPADCGASSAAGSGSCLVPTYWWGGLVKLQVLGCPPDTELVFFGPQALLVEASVEDAASPGSAAGSDSGSDSGDEGWRLGRGMAGMAEEPHGFGATSVMRRGGLRPAKDLKLKCGAGGGRRHALADIAVSGIPGWVAIYTSGGPGDAVRVRVWTPPGVEVFSRPPLPVPSPLAPPEQAWAAPEAPAATAEPPSAAAAEPAMDAVPAAAEPDSSGAVEPGSAAVPAPRQQRSKQPASVDDWW